MSRVKRWSKESAADYGQRNFCVPHMFYAIISHEVILRDEDMLRS